MYPPHHADSLDVPTHPCLHFRLRSGSHPQDDGYPPDEHAKAGHGLDYFSHIERALRADQKIIRDFLPYT